MQVEDRLICIFAQPLGLSYHKCLLRMVALRCDIPVQCDIFAVTCKLLCIHALCQLKAGIQLYRSDMVAKWLSWMVCHLRGCASLL